MKDRIKAAESGPKPDFDLSNSENFAHGFPHEYFAWLRKNAPAFWHEPTEYSPDGEGFWVISRYADVASIQRDPKTFSSDKGGTRTGGGTALKDERSAGIMLNMTDDPHHRRLRSLVNKGFTPKSIRLLESQIKDFTQSLLDDVAGQEPFDFVNCVARELPLQMICNVLGVPKQDRAQLCEWVDLGLATRSESVMAGEYTKLIRDYALTLIDLKRREPQDDIFSSIVHARFEEDGSSLTDRELVAFFNLLFPAGAETTRSALGGSVQAFIDHPDQFRRLKGDRTLMRSAVEEVVRWTTPSIYKRRTATCDTRLHGQLIRAGDKVSFWEMSANRDERAIDNPWDFDIGRWPNKHLGFGAGVHFCLGASLARMEINVALEALADRYSGFKLAGSREWMPNNRLLGLRKLMIETVTD